MVSLSIFLLDLMITLIIATDETIPLEWIQRRSFTNSRKLIIIVWIVMGSILSWGYRVVLQYFTQEFLVHVLYALKQLLH